MESAFAVKFTGAYCDPVTGGYPFGNGYRIYLPELMRFSAPDDWSPFGSGGVHSYTYCGDDPTNHSDVNGHMSSIAWTGIVAGAIGLILIGAPIFGTAIAAATAAEEGLIAGLSRGGRAAWATMKEMGVAGVAGTAGDIAGIGLGAGGMGMEKDDKDVSGFMMLVSTMLGPTLGLGFSAYSFVRFSGNKLRLATELREARAEVVHALNDAMDARLQSVAAQNQARILSRNIGSHFGEGDIDVGRGLQLSGQLRRLSTAPPYPENEPPRISPRVSTATANSSTVGVSGEPPPSYEEVQASLSWRALEWLDADESW